MAEVTREIIVGRALEIFNQCGYIWGAWPGTNPAQMCDLNTVTGRGELGGGPYIATDCSGFTSWCWALGYKRGSGSWAPSGEFGGNYRPRAQSEVQSYESLFPGIQPGDVLWRDGHVALYIGNGQIMQASTQSWAATPTGRGMRRSTNDFNFKGYISWDGTFSPDYNPALNIIVANVSDGEVGPYPNIIDVSAMINYYNFYDWQYTRKYRLMKRWRRI